MHPPSAAAPRLGVGGPPGMLASSADRERAIDVVKAAYGEGRLTKEEFDHRVNRITAARTYGDLSMTISDLPAVASHPNPGADLPSRRLFVRVGLTERGGAGLV